MCLPLASWAQGTREITLREAIALAREQSLDALEARRELHAAAWQYRNYKADLLPRVVIGGTLPSLNKSYSRYQNEDGSYTFVTTSMLAESLTFSVEQAIGLTGGTLSLESSVDQVEQIGDASSRRVSSVPVSLSLSQPLFAYNEFKWRRRIEPLQLVEARKQYRVNLEAIAVKVIGYYFDLLLAQVNDEIARQELEHVQKLFQIAEGKKKRGMIEENEFLQLKLNYINASAAVIETGQALEQRVFQLSSFLNIGEGATIVARLPEDVPPLEVSHEQVLELANAHHPFAEQVKQRLIEMEQTVAMAKAQRRPTVSTYFSVGYSGAGDSFPSAYCGLQNRQMLGVNVSIPLLDWGKARGNVEMAKLQREVEEQRVEKDVEAFEQDVKQLVTNIQNQNRLVQTYKLADTIAQNRYRIAYETFLMGKISVLDLNSARLEKSTAKRNYINQLYNSWLLYYQLRQLSLYDFLKNQPLFIPKKPSLWIREYRKKSPAGGNGDAS